MAIRRVDANHKEITKALRAIGAFVQSLHEIGKGCVDLLVAYRGRWFALECKDGSKKPSEQRLTPDEQKWHDAASRCAPVHVVHSVEEAIAVVTNNKGGTNNV